MSYTHGEMLPGTCVSAVKAVSAFKGKLWNGMAESAEGVRRGSGADSVYNELLDAGEGELP